MANSRICSIPECGKAHKALGYCKIHYDRFKYAGRTELLKEPIRTCTMPGCDRPHAARGWCGNHYTNWIKRGDPAAFVGTRKADTKAHLDGLLSRTDFPEHECVGWPFTRNNKGYGVATYKGRREYVHRIMCEAANGPAPTKDHEAAHACGKGHEGCCNPRHLSWKTHQENHADRIGLPRRRAA